MEELVKAAELTESEKIKKYISLYKTAPDAEVKKTTKKPSLKKTNHFTVDLSSGLDCVITGRSKEGDIQLIIMPSQNKYLLKKGEVVQKITNEKMISDFFYNLPKEGLVVNNVVIDKITPSNVKFLYTLISNYSVLLSKGLISLQIVTNHYLKRIFTDGIQYDEKFLKLIVSKTPILKQSNYQIEKKYDYQFVELAHSFYKRKGYDALRMFVEEYVKSSIESVAYSRYNYGYYGYGRNTYSGYDFLTYDLDTKRVIEYICFDLYKQGYTSIPCSTYYDYLRMSNEYYGKIKDKYPEYLDTAHDVMAIKHSEAKERIDKEAFERIYDAFKRNFKEYEEISYNKIKLIRPENAESLVDEGINLGHCVGSYISRVKSGECIILFARRIGSEDNSYLTVELRPVNEYGKTNYEIRQIQGDNKRTTLTYKEIEFFKIFSKKTGIGIKNFNFE